MELEGRKANGRLDARIPPGPIQEKWSRRRDDMKLVSPANKRRHTIIVVGTGLAGASAAASLGELGYAVEAFAYQDSPRRAHSIAAQGGINAAKNYKNDGDSVYRLFYVVAVAGLGVHLWHGLWSMTQSLGQSNRGWTPGVKRLAVGLAVVIAVGFAAVPLAVVLGVLGR